MRRFPVLLAGCGWLLVSGAAPADALTCSMAASPLAFGAYNPLAASSTDTVATVQITCTSTVSLLVSFTVSLSPGNGTLTNRRLQGSRFSLPYQVYTDMARSQAWGDGTVGTSLQSGGFLLSALGSVTTNLVGYGRIPGQQNVGAGSYGDTLMVTINY